MLFQELGKMKRSWIMRSILLIGVGITMIMCPVRYLGMLISALGYVLLVWAVTIGLDFLSSKKVLINYFYLTAGMLIGLLGLFVLVQRRDILPILSLLFGLFMVGGGLYDLFNAFMYARRAGRAAWWILAVLSVLTIVCGVVLLINLWWDSTEHIKVVIGGMLLFSSVVSIIRVILTWPFRNV